ncbi:MAG TPA: Bax inhibitor-1/YccA family protein [Leptospiraceae bacterium]|nr:Bax inhibitor-1/YccA family protein [Leptospiraceae bacterium]HMW04895.1 Bax inhibitor-1/YccA family protein [Leptospiraceae bacterium]HMX34417.1 Bax inhibitor-1/YccA family protein [Leptospiraceae bacterium]HMY30884.1 Bax inhibitor-1/YccA family protein [Leptospiraceae bacterium]HMZ62688.1 Bax inhibitor-1/YccA family protein [Leptospiraceae bacterium]
MNQSYSMSPAQVMAEQQRFIVKVYSWMSVALGLTGIVSMLVASSETALRIVVGNSFVFYGLLIGEFILVATLSGLVQKMNATVATFVFLFYAALNGLTFSIIFVVYTSASISSTFYITAGTFALTSFYGYVTKSDLTKLGNLFMMALIGLILASVVNLFMKSEAIYWITTYIGVILFVGLTAYDTQKIKNMNIIGNEGTEEDQKEAIMGALTLYLDFINLFLYLLRIFGRRR